MVSFDKSLLQGEALRFSADFNHSLLYERPFKFPRHLVGPLGINNIIAVSAINIHSAIFKLISMEMDMETETKMETETDMET